MGIKKNKQTLNQTTNSYSNNTYTYAYDKLNRLTSGTSIDNNNETGITYDLMGNIKTLNRSGLAVDNLTYNYTNAGNATNQLQSINDASGNATGLKAGTSSFTYDNNGNLITDPTKGTSGITIAYNLLNLPQSITGSKTITYVYDAAGNKLRRLSTATNNTDYVSGIQYDGTTTQNLTFIQTEEGKAVPTGSSYDYVYYIGDNLGNTRVTFDVQNNVATALQKDDYYPFGFEISRLGGNGTKNEYLYNSKELQEETGLYDYGYRHYDPILARWTTSDPLAEFHYETTPYNYVLNNPISFMDLLGLDTIRMNSNAPIHTGDVIEVSPGNYTTSNTNEVPIVGKKSDKDANQRGQQSSFDLGPGLWLTSTTFSLLNENATRNIKAIKETNSWWTKMTGKLPGRAARDLEAETFTKTATDIIGKRIFVAGVLYSAYSIYKDHSVGNVAINVLDNVVGAAGIWIPGMQIPALIYFGGRLAYDLYNAK